MIPSLEFRAACSADFEALRQLFMASIQGLALSDYSLEQRNAWSEFGNRSSAFDARLNKTETFVAETNGVIAGFVAYTSCGTIDLLYVHPRFARQGVALNLLTAVENEMDTLGVSSISADVSDTARAVFEKAGYTFVRRNTVQRSGVELQNTSMEKQLSCQTTVQRCCDTEQV